MAHFHRYPAEERISGQVVTAGGTSLAIGLWGYMDGSNELLVDSASADVRVTRGGTSGNSRLYTLSGAEGTSALIRATPPGAGRPWDTFTVRFQAAGLAPVSVTPITSAVYGYADANHMRAVSLPPRRIVATASFRAGTTTPLDFGVADAKSGKLGVFAVRTGSQTGAIALLCQSGGDAVNRVLISITHGFHQGNGPAKYGALNWSDPLSSDLIETVVTENVLGDDATTWRFGYGAQVLNATRKRMALLCPIRSQSELGPFRGGGNFWRQVLGSVATLTGLFTPENVEFSSFSSGIYDLNAILSLTTGQLAIRTVYNIDPSGGISATAPRGAVLKQFISGQTTHGQSRAGFELLSAPRWVREPEYSRIRTEGAFNYLHNLVMPFYTLHLGIETS